MNKQNLHNFHIPVMGLAFTIDSPIRVAQFGIDSVISIVDDELMEKMNAFYSKKFNFPYKEITTKHFDFRAERTKSYLNLVSKIVEEKCNEFGVTYTSIPLMSTAINSHFRFIKTLGKRPANPVAIQKRPLAAAMA